jgi:ribose/xylose/arabinose/galactoside ABC-type transport system permease subunit
MNEPRRLSRTKRWTVAIAVGLVCAVWQVWFWNDGADSNSSLPMLLFAPIAGIVATILTAVLLELVDDRHSSGPH